MEEVVLVDGSGADIGTEERLYAHRHGLLHRAVSVYVFNPAGELLLQRRAPGKALFAGRWANTCCTHVGREESVVATGERRLRDEMGLVVALSNVGAFVYEARDPVSGLIEHEYDHVLVGVTDGEPDPDPDEVDGIEWVNLKQLRRSANDSRYAPWLDAALRAFPNLGPFPLENRGRMHEERHGGPGHQ